MGSIPSKQENDYIDEIVKEYYNNDDKNDIKNNNETKNNKIILKKNIQDMIKCFLFMILLDNL